MRLGPYLRSQREQKGITLREMEEKSKIRRDVIQILETGDFKELPDDSHTSYLIRTYCDAIQLDAEILLERYKDEIPTKKEVYKERNESKVNKDFVYLKKTIYTFLAVIGVLFVIWLVLLQVGSQGDVFRKVPVYDAVSSEQSSEQTLDVKLDKVEDETAFYNITTNGNVKISFKGEGTLVNITDDNDETYVNEKVSDDTFLIDNEAKQLFIAVEDNSKVSLFINDNELEDDEVKTDGTLFYQFNIERD